MQITETHSEGLNKTYRVIVAAADIDRATETELKTLSAQVKIPGFRPGNVPLKVMQQRYGKSVQNDVLKSVVSDATEKVIRDNKLNLAYTPEVKVEKFEEGGELVFTLGLDLLPEVPEVKFEGISIEREVFEIDDAAVDDALKNLTQNYPEPKALPSGAKAEEGHMLTIDFKGMIGGKVFEGGTAEGFRIVLGSGRLIPGFEDQLIGAEAGEGREVKVSFPKDYFSKEMAGKDAAFEVKVQEVAKLETPEADDAFAKARGLKDLATLRAMVRERLTHEYGSIVRTRLKKRLFDALEEECTFPLPPRMVQAEFEGIWNNLQQNKTGDDVDVYEGRTEAEVKKEYQHIAERRVKLGLLLADIGRREKLQVGREELSRALMERASQFQGQEQAVMDFYRKNPQRLDEFRGPILEEKAVDWILAKVKMRDQKVTTKELAGDESVDNSTSESAKKPAKAQATPKKKAATPKKKPKEPDNE